jgi:Zn-dependent protease
MFDVLCRRLVACPRMNGTELLDGLIDYVFLVIIITFHEFGHAWAAWRCGDDTARLQGRITLNPVAHMDLIGTVVLPLLAVVLRAGGSGLAGFIIGWGKPVPVNILQLRRRKFDDMLVAMAGPLMNVLIALFVMAIARTGVLMNSQMLVEACVRLAQLSMFLCFFNLLPIPPLDGSHVLKYLLGMSYETFWRISQFGILIVLIVIQIPQVRYFLAISTDGSVQWMGRLFRFPIG